MRAKLDSLPPCKVGGESGVLLRVRIWVVSFANFLIYFPTLFLPAAVADRGYLDGMDYNTYDPQ